MLYFDITSIIRYAESNDRVTGIQRVQLRLITDMVAMHGTTAIRGTAYFGRQRGWQSIDLSFLAEHPEFDARRFLLGTGRIVPSRFPSRDQVKRYLAPYDGRKLARGLKKVLLYATAAASPSAIRARGFTLYSHQDCRHKAAVPLRPMSPADTYVLLGENGANPETERMALAHHARGGRVVQMIHDLIPWVRPDLHTARFNQLHNTWLERSTKYVDTYLCVSTNTARDLGRFLAGHPHAGDVQITPLAHEFAGFPRNAAADPPPALGGKAYVLCVGSIEIRKNGLALLKAWQLLKEQLGAATPCLVFAGKKGWMIDSFEKELERSGHLDGLVHLIERPSDLELVSLYRHCLFTVYPSLYEGWGLPVGEGAWFGKFGVVSCTSSMPEVCGDLMDYVDPTSPEGIAAVLAKPLVDRHYLAQRQSQVEQARLRAWTDVARDVLAHLLSPRRANGQAMPRA